MSRRVSRMHGSKAEAIEALAVLRAFGGSATTIQIFEQIWKRSRRRMVNNSISSLRDYLVEQMGLTREDVTTEFVCKTAKGKMVYRYTLSQRAFFADRKQTGLFEREGQECTTSTT